MRLAKALKLPQPGSLSAGQPADLRGLAGPLIDAIAPSRVTATLQRFFSAMTHQPFFP